MIPLLLLLLAAGPIRAAQDSQNIVSPQGNWAFATSEVSRSYLRSERITVSGELQQLQFNVLMLNHDGYNWSACDESESMLRLQIHADSLGRPGNLLFNDLLPFVCESSDVYYGGQLELHLVSLPVPLAGVSDAWFSISGEGQPDCLLLWGKGYGGDNYSYLDRGLGWETVPYDLSYIATYQTIQPPVLDISLLPDGQLELSWVASGSASLFLVEQSTDGDQWQPLAQTTNHSLLISRAGDDPDLELYRVRNVEP